MSVCVCVCVCVREREREREGERERESGCRRLTLLVAALKIQTDKTVSRDFKINGSVGTVDRYQCCLLNNELFIK